MNKKSHYRWIIPIIIVGMVLLGIFIWQSSDQIRKGAEKHRDQKLENTITTPSKSSASMMHPIVGLAQKSKPVTDEEVARLENWKRNFPFKPVFHPSLKHDPGLYDTNDPSTWDVPDDPKEK